DLWLPPLLWPEDAPIPDDLSHYDFNAFAHRRGVTRPEAPRPLPGGGLIPRHADRGEQPPDWGPLLHRLDPGRLAAPPPRRAPTSGTAGSAPRGRGCWVRARRQRACVSCAWRSTRWGPRGWRCWRRPRTSPG